MSPKSKGSGLPRRTISNATARTKIPSAAGMTNSQTQSVSRERNANRRSAGAKAASPSSRRTPKLLRRGGRAGMHTILRWLYDS